MQVTSLEAYNKIKHCKHTHHNIIHDVLELIGEGTAEDIANYPNCPLDSVEVNRRLSEMERDNVVEVCGRTANRLKWSLCGRRLPAEQIEDKRKIMNDFFKAVKDMRTAQKEHSRFQVKQSKESMIRAEDAVDRFIEKLIDSTKVKQQELFKNK